MNALHPSWKRLLAYGTGEDDARLSRHLARCAGCRARLAESRSIRSAAEEVMTPPAPADAWERIRAAREEGRRVILPVQPLAPRSRRPVRAPARAALLLLFGGVGGVAASVLAGPVAELFRSSDAPREAAETIEAPRTAGVAVRPAAGVTRITLMDSDPAVQVQVELVAGDLVEVRGSGGAADASFRPSADGVTVRQAGAGTVFIALPQGRGTYVVEMDGREVLTSDGHSLRVLGDRTDRGRVILRAPDPR